MIRPKSCIAICPTTCGFCAAIACDQFVISECTTGNGSVNGFEYRYVIMTKNERMTFRETIIPFAVLRYFLDICHANSDRHNAQKYTFSVSIHSGIANLDEVNCIPLVWYMYAVTYSGYITSIVLYILKWNHMRTMNPRAIRIVFT